jgi:c-di-GMP-binding flagellar brake protein YcgR
MRIADHPAVLMRELRARIVNISETGCLIETRRRLDVGTVGTMRLRLGAEEYGDDLEIVRCEAVGSALSLYHVGVRFLWTTPRHAGSIRHAVARHAAELDWSDTAFVM